MAKLGVIFSNQWLDLDGPNNRSLLPLGRKVKPRHHHHHDQTVRATFQLPRAKIEKLRRLVLVNDVVEHDHHHCLHVSTFSVTCAFTLVCLVKAEINEIDDTNIRLVFQVNCRSRLEPPLPTAYFGNCIAAKYVDLEKQKLVGKEGFVEAVHAISEAIKSLEKGSVLNGAENWLSIFIASIYNNSSKSSSNKVLPGGVRYAIAGSPRFEVYGIDFGWGKPKKVDLIIGGICLLDSKNGDGGVEIGLVLKKHNMEAFALFFAQGLDRLSSKL